MKTMIEKLLHQADQAAGQENWEEACQHLETVLTEAPQHAAALTGLGISKLHQNDPAAAAEHFQEVVQLHPQSPQAYNNLGVAFALQSIWEEAEAAYQQAIDLDPENAQAWKNLAEVYLQQNFRLTEGVQILAAVLKNNPRDTEALSMLAGCYEEIDDHESAALLYRQMLEVEGDHPHAEKRLEVLDLPRPSAHRIARPEHAQKLAALKNLSGGNGKASSSPQAPRSVAFLGPEIFPFRRRFEGPARTFSSAGRSVKFASRLEPEDLDRYQTFIIHRPHQTQELHRTALRLLKAGKKVIIDLDLDFSHIPEDHPEYDRVGPGNPQALERLQEIFQAAQWVTVPTEELADRLRPKVDRVITIPTGWAREGSTWNAPKPSRKTVNFGLLSTHVHAPLDPTIRDQISESIADLPEGLLAAAGDYQLLAQFDQLPEEKKLFLPLGAFQDYPYTLAHFDVLLVPERINTFTKTKSDLPLLEAGLRQIPWLATRIPSYTAWEAGGHFVSTGGWQTFINRLGQNPEERKTLGMHGFQKAKQRESSLTSSWWKDLIEEAST